MLAGAARAPAFRQKVKWALEQFGYVSADDTKNIVMFDQKRWYHKYASKDGVPSEDRSVYNFHPDSLITGIEGTRLLASDSVSEGEMRWFDALQVDSPTLHGPLVLNRHAAACTVAAELYERMGQCKRAIEFAQAELVRDR